MVLPTVGKALPYQSMIFKKKKKGATQLVTVQSDGGGFSIEVSSSQMTLVSLIEKTNQHTRF